MPNCFHKGNLIEQHESYRRPLPFLLSTSTEQSSMNCTAPRVLVLALSGVLGLIVGAHSNRYAAPPSSAETATTSTISAPQEDAPRARLSRQIDTIRVLGRYIATETDRVRANHDLDTLLWDDTLEDIACQHTTDMIQRGYFEHVSPDGDLPSDRVARGHRRFVGEVGENLWSMEGNWQEGHAALAESIVHRWMDSPPHRKTLLRHPSTHTGVCTLRQGQTWYGTQIVARARGSLASPLPDSIEAGRTLPVEIAETRPPDLPVVRYDIWSPVTDTRVTSASVFVDTLNIPDTTGTYRPRFYFLHQGVYEVHEGPEFVVITSRSKGE